MNQRNVTWRKNRHSRTKNGDDSRLGKWNNVSQGTLASHLKCWEKYNWLRILYPRKIHIKNKIKYVLTHTTIQDCITTTFYKRSQVRRNLKRSENLDSQGEWTVPKIIREKKRERLIPSWGTTIKIPCQTGYLPKALLPNSITLGVKGGHNIIHSSYA